MRKAELAQVVAQALFNYDELPAQDCARVRNLVKGNSKQRLEELYEQALAILERR